MISHLWLRVPRFTMDNLASRPHSHKFFHDFVGELSTIIGLENVRWTEHTEYVLQSERHFHSLLRLVGAKNNKLRQVVLIVADPFKVVIRLTLHVDQVYLAPRVHYVGNDGLHNYRLSYFPLLEGTCLTKVDIHLYDLLCDVGMSLLQFVVRYITGSVPSQQMLRANRIKDLVGTYVQQVSPAIFKKRAGDTVQTCLEDNKFVQQSGL